MLTASVLAVAPKLALMMIMVILYKMIEKFVIEKIMDLFQRIKGAVEVVVKKVKEGFIQLYDNTLGNVFGKLSKQQIVVFCRDCASLENDGEFDQCVDDCVKRNALVPLRLLDDVPGVSEMRAAVTREQLPRTPVSLLTT